MKHASTRSHSLRQVTSRVQHRPIAGPGGIAIAPPAYGIDFVDRQQSTAGEMTVQPYGGETSLPPAKQQENRTGLPDHLKAGIENLSGFDLSDVNVHFNSAKPAALQALAYTQGSDIHVAPGQERHLSHEAWHVVQQKQGRVQPTMQMQQKILVNDDQDLEQEADVMGAKAAQISLGTQSHVAQHNSVSAPSLSLAAVVQRYPLPPGFHPTQDQLIWRHDGYDYHGHSQAEIIAQIEAGWINGTGQENREVHIPWGEGTPSGIILIPREWNEGKRQYLVRHAQSAASKAQSSMFSTGKSDASSDWRKT